VTAGAKNPNRLSEHGTTVYSKLQLMMEDHDIDGVVL
jgi:hypothetical protein